MIERNENQFAGAGEGTASIRPFNSATQVVALLPGSAWRPASPRLDRGYNVRPIAFREVSPP